MFDFGIKKLKILDFWAGVQIRNWTSEIRNQQELKCYFASTY